MKYGRDFTKIAWEEKVTNWCDVVWSRKHELLVEFVEIELLT